MKQSPLYSNTYTLKTLRKAMVGFDGAALWLLHVSGRQRDIERETETQRDRDTETQRDRERQTDRDRETDRQTETEGQRQRKTETQTDRHRDRVCGEWEGTERGVIPNLTSLTAVIFQTVTTLN